MFLDKVATVARMTIDPTDNDKEEYVTVTGLEAVRINVQPASAELVAVTDGAFGQTYQAFVAVSGIKISDRVTISGSNSKTLIVKGVSDWHWGPLPHVELVLWEGDN